MAALRFLLYPISWLYGLGVRLRNFLFDSGLRRSVEPSVPTLCVGNLAVGGTGKTPCVKFIARLLGDEFRVAVLSRGYGRTTRGYRRVTPSATASEVGDEPLEIFRAFGGQIPVAVCERRPEGVERLLTECPDIDLILLDDAFQHRTLQAGLNLLLTAYDSPYPDDTLLPVGRLREPASGSRRADLIVVSKCPVGLPDFERLKMLKHLDPLRRQHVFFSTIAYADSLYPLSGEGSIPVATVAGAAVLAIAAIAHPEPFFGQVNALSPTTVKTLHFPDHHRFSMTDCSRIIDAFSSLPSTAERLILTTTKDATRLAESPLPESIKAHIHVLDADMRLLDDAPLFHKILSDYVHKSLTHRRTSETLSQA